MKNKIIPILFLFLFFKTPAQENDFAVLFYNAENLFDWKDDPHTNDNEFTPEGDRHWTYKRFQQKMNNTSKALLGALGWDIPLIIGFCEIENRQVLEQMIEKTALHTVSFRIIHKESTDPRGIDVALLYNSEIFYPLQYEYFPFVNADGSIRQTREILYTSGIVADGDTLHLFINHWPSRYSGLLETRPLRNRAATLLRQKVDSVFQQQKEAKIIIIGDFNDQPTDASILDYLNTAKPGSNFGSDKLYNLSTSWMQAGMGTLKYQSQWFIFDQIIVSGALLNAENGLYTEPEWASIFSAGFLLEDDKIHGGLKPSRTYTGFRYNGGFGDHLPVKLRLRLH